MKNNTHITNPKHSYLYKVDNPTAPKLNSLIKLHKPNQPIRPLINSKTAPNYKIAKHIAKLLKNKIKLNNNYTIKNSYHLTEHLKNIKVNENTKLYSFDVKNMYTNIPITETINIITQKLIKNKEDDILIKQITSTLKTILNQNYFQHNQIIYQQTDGLAMGAPTSAIISEIFLQELDEQIINTIKTNDTNGKYYRYVDDTIYISQNNGKNIEKIKNTINKIHNNIKFTIEEETNNKLNFLDLTIINKIPKLEFKIYRKETQTDQIIPNNTNHPYQHKMATFHSLIHRMLRLPSVTQKRIKKGT